MANLAHGLKKIQTVSTEAPPDFSGLWMLEMEESKKDFGTKHHGYSFLHVWTHDQAWVMWLIQALYGNSKKPSHVKFLKFIVGMKIDGAELEGISVPVTEPALQPISSLPLAKGAGKSLKPKAKVKGQASAASATPGSFLEEIEDFEDEETFELLQPIETEKDAEIQCLQSRMLNIENALQQVIQHLGAQQASAEQ